MAITKDLFRASQHSYDKLENPEISTSFNEFIEITSSVDKKTGHGAVAYYAKESGEVIIAHNGTDVTNIRHLISDLKIGTGFKQTRADKSAIAFTKKVLGTLSENNQPISHVYQTGHSKGGHEAQICAAYLANVGEVPVSFITFNAPGIRNANKKNGIRYDGVNLQATGTLFGDLVSMGGGNQLGQSVTISVPSENKYLSALGAHTMTSLRKALDTIENSLIYYGDVKEVIAASEQNHDARGVEAHIMNTLMKLDQQKSEQHGVPLMANSFTDSAKSILVNKFDPFEKFPDATKDEINRKMQAKYNYSANIGDQDEVTYDQALNKLIKKQTSSQLTGSEFTSIRSLNEAPVNNTDIFKDFNFNPAINLKDKIVIQEMNNKAADHYLSGGSQSKIDFQALNFEQFRLSRSAKIACDNKDVSETLSFRN